MRKYIILICGLIFTHLAAAQEKKLTADSDTVYWYNIYNTLGSKIKVETARNKNSDFFFRFWDGFKVVEITQNNSEVQGNIVFFIQQYKSNKEGRVFFRHVPLTKPSAEIIYEKILKYKLLDLPTDKQIQEWQQGLDGITYITEYASKNEYSFKNYWTPTAQKELGESKQLLGFINELRQIRELEDKYTHFMQRQPFQSWYGGFGSSIIVSKIITAR